MRRNISTRLKRVWLITPAICIITSPDKNRLLIEDRYKTEEFSVAQIIDSQTIKVFPKVFNNYALTDGLKLIIADRFLYNAWPDSIEYGTIFKGTMLKAAAISWFAWEEQLQKQKPMDVSLS